MIVIVTFACGRKHRQASVALGGYVTCTSFSGALGESDACTSQAAGLWALYQQYWEVFPKDSFVLANETVIDVSGPSSPPDAGAPPSPAEGGPPFDPSLHNCTHSAIHADAFCNSKMCPPVCFPLPSTGEDFLNSFMSFLPTFEASWAEDVEFWMPGRRRFPPERVVLHTSVY